MYYYVYETKEGKRNRFAYPEEHLCTAVKYARLLARAWCLCDSSATWLVFDDNRNIVKKGTVRK